MKIIESAFLIFLFFMISSCKGQISTKQVNNPKDNVNIELSPSTSEVPNLDTLLYPNAPQNITRTIIQDSEGLIWFATFEGVFKYDGRKFTNVTKGITKSRFFSAFEDNAGNLWFGSIGSGVYLYDGDTFQNFSIEDGLIDNDIVSICQDTKGNLWFGANGGTSRYDGTSFVNYLLNIENFTEDISGIPIQKTNQPFNEVNTIMEDKNGMIWFATRGNTYKYDGQTFLPISNNGKRFSNIRWIIEDKKGNIWHGGNGGLWRFDGISYTHISKNFVGYIYEDSKGNIWTSSESAISSGWALSRYEGHSLDSNQISVTEIKGDEGMFFGITEDNEGNIWAGSLNGAYKYDGQILSYFKNGIE